VRKAVGDYTINARFDLVHSALPDGGARRPRAEEHWASTGTRSARRPDIYNYVKLKQQLLIRDVSPTEYPITGLDA